MPRHNEPDAIQYSHLVLALRMKQATLECLESCTAHQLSLLAVSLLGPSFLLHLWISHGSFHDLQDVLDVHLRQVWAVRRLFLDSPSASTPTEQDAELRPVRRGLGRCRLRALPHFSRMAPT